MRIFSAKRGIALSLIGAAITIAACKKIELVNSNKTEVPSITSSKSKVLLVVVDGLVGKELAAINPPTIQTILPHSTYSWDALADTVTTDGASWGNIMTAVGSSVNTITDSTLTAKTASGERYPSFLQLMEQTSSRNIRTIAITPWEQLNQTLLSNADVKISIPNNDNDLVRDSAVAHLKSDSADLVIVHFNNVNLAGKEDGFYASSPAYAAALETFDSYLADLLNAINDRTNSGDEDWLLIVQSTHGGVDKSYGGRTDQEMNCFSLYYNPSLYGTKISLPQSIKYNTRLFGKDESAVNAVLEDDQAYNFGETGNYTIELKMRTFNKGANAYYPAFFSKRQSFDGGVVGWCMFLESNYWMINFGKAGSGNSQLKGATINDANWHHLSVVIYTNTDNNKRYVRTYTDGALNGEKEITDRGNVNSPAPLRMGFIPGSVSTPADIYMSDVRIFNDSLSTETIQQFSCTNVIDESHPKFNNLVGHWNATEGTGNVIRNTAPGGGPSFVLASGARWDLLNYILPCAGNESVVPPYNTEVFNQIAYWLNVPINNDWQIANRFWLKFF
ncbi:hypothetical protein COR50_01370 [Chitinophaga caeni]|uniref:Uncharacterized protein n=1 Tax=Chitinophaga caeni TaxID=2029983 RepID=A0A291QPJ1_9BACT|nr:LamG-like jellyroll fold domain-containing protein [Chitinophaga caeni]ATL45918.1 hypothetical protein COR50_01370 [Chitinophaga caeni]